jgi:hypothetical protein
MTRKDKTLAANMWRLIESMARCETSGNAEWSAKHYHVLKRLIDNHLPHGSGLDGDNAIDASECALKGRIDVHTQFHHMNEVGYYDGWTDHVISVRPAFDGTDVRVSGRNRNDIKDYLGEIFTYAFEALIPDADIVRYYAEAVQS